MSLMIYPQYHAGCMKRAPVLAEGLGESQPGMMLEGWAIDSGASEHFTSNKQCLGIATSHFVSEMLGQTFQLQGVSEDLIKIRLMEMLTTKCGLRQDDLIVKRGRRWYFLLMKRREESLHIYRRLRRLYAKSKNVSWVTHTIPSVPCAYQASKTAYESVLGALSAEFGMRVAPMEQRSHLHRINLLLGSPEDHSSRLLLMPPTRLNSSGLQRLLEQRRILCWCSTPWLALLITLHFFCVLASILTFWRFFDLNATDRQVSAAVVGSRRLWQIKGSLTSSAIACWQLYLLRLTELW
ncbi:hypothetical protein MIR68_009279 [Amoeboaphelidium protococcarum]|nr:hypothetical protein MIR68_009279 [Amoeboaphelidium protococcarum]